LFFYELRTHSSFYLDMTIAGALILGALGFYIGVAKGWLSQQREELQETHDFYRARIEEEVLRAKKLEAVSRLAGGIAHDFNNVLTMVLGNLALAKLSAGLEEETEERITAAEKAILSAKSMTQQLLTFSKGGAPIKKTIDANRFIRDAAEFSARSSKLPCDVSLASPLDRIDIDHGQMTQALHQLILNAHHAMPQGGKVRVSGEARTLGPRDDLPLPHGKYVKIAVSDAGVGIPESHLPNIFDPYFTTKSAGGGLGLTIAHSIVAKHEGCIRVESKEKVGSTFNVYLPISENPVLEPAAAPAPENPPNDRVLVMDDEEMIRSMLENLLGRFGYDVVVASDGAETVKAYKEASLSAKPFDGVILDLTVRDGVGGREAIQQLLAFDPEVKAIVSSGYSTDPIMSAHQDYGFKGVVSKPYNTQDLLKTLRQVIRGVQV
jgi:signal transduction histidine kinase/CheY-like chemotaxis protein